MVNGALFDFAGDVREEGKNVEENPSHMLGSFID